MLTVPWRVICLAFGICRTAADYWPQYGGLCLERHNLARYCEPHFQLSPNKERALSLHKLAVYLGVCRDRFRCRSTTDLWISLSLYDVSVRSLAALA